MAVFSTGRVEYFVFDKAVNGECFDAFIKSLSLDDNHVIVADNASIHFGLKKKLPPAQVLCTPVYQPEFNAIELCFGIVKRNFVP